jgi:hypothetical protein
MRPVHDIDVIILVATALASKRRPAELAEIIAAAELVQGFIPYVEKLGEALQRLSSFGLISASESGFTLTPAALEIMADQPKRATTEDLIIAVKGGLAAYTPKGESATILVTIDQLRAAIQSHKISRKASGKNLLMPKPEIDRHFKVDGRWRRVSATHGRKS